MALLALRLRRTLTALPSLSRSLSSPTPFTVSSCSLLPNPTATNFASSSPDTFHCRSFRSSVALLSSSTRQFKLYKEGDEIDENTILFEGCDYNHWLIVVDFPRDQPKPPAEEMIRTYERICAEGLGVSIEEAKKRIYACSTTTYEGFQVEMTEEESQKFESLPGVVFVLPDSYIDPVNKQYGGDKYENGVITPRPLPPQYANNNRRRPRDRDDRGRYDPQGRQTWQGNPPYNHQGPVQGDGRNLGPQQGHPAQNYVPQPTNNQSYDPQPSVNNRSYAPQPAMNNRSYAPQPAMNNRSYAPQPEMNNRSYEQQQPVNSQSYGQQPPMSSSQNYTPPSPVKNQNYGMQPPMNSQIYGPGRRDPYKGAGSGTSPPVNRGNFSQDGQRNYNPQEQREEQQMGQGNVAPTGPGYEQVASPRFGEGTHTSYGQGNWKEANPGHGQGLNPGSGQGTGPGYNRQVHGQGTNPGFGQGVGPSYGQNYSQGGNPVYGQGANPQEQRDEQQTGQGNVAPTGPGYEQVVSPRFGEGTNTSYGQGNWKEANPGYGQGANPGSGQGTGPGYNSQVHGQGANPGFGQGVGPCYGQSYSQGANPGYAQGLHGDGQRIPQSEQSAPLGPGGIVQGRF